MNIATADSPASIKEAIHERLSSKAENSDEAVKKGVDLIAIAKELAKRMRERGWTCDARNPVISITGTIMRYSQFEKTGPNVFRLKVQGGLPNR